MQHAALVQPREQQLAADPVVVAHARAGDREAEDAVEDHRVLHERGVLEHLLLGVGRARRPRRDARVEGALDRHALAERGQVAPQLLERVEEERHPLLDHERVERQIAAHVGAVVDDVPHHERLLGQRLVVEHRARRSSGRSSFVISDAARMTRR